MNLPVNDNFKMLALLAAFAVLVASEAATASISNDAGGDITLYAWNPVQRLADRISAGTKRPELVVYNRVPKSGSSTMQDHIDRLSLEQGFRPVHFVRPPSVDCPKTQLPCLGSQRSPPNASEVERLIYFLESTALKRGAGKNVVGAPGVWHGINSMRVVQCMWLEMCNLGSAWLNAGTVRRLIHVMEDTAI